MRNEEQKSSDGNASAKPRKRRRVSRRIFGDTHAQTSEYPGFFVLPRARPAGSPLQRRWDAFKESLVVFLVLIGFAGGVAYFFAQVTPDLSETPPLADAVPFVSQPKTLHTNVTEGVLRR
jgi:hypothetical protein